MEYSVWISPSLGGDLFIVRLLVGSREVTIYDNVHPELNGYVAQYSYHDSLQSIERAYTRHNWTKVT